MKLVRVDDITWINPELIQRVIVSALAADQYEAEVVLIDKPNVTLYVGTKEEAVKKAIEFMEFYDLADERSLKH